ncbi:MAG: TetR family transcriptional regulator [Thermodesulfobacteriota bacterium]
MQRTKTSADARVAAHSGGDARDETTRDRILAASLRVFATRGFDGARTRDIAELADANLGLIKYYFGDKEGLWKEAVARAFRELGEELAVALAPREDGDERAQLEEVVRRFVRFVARNPAFMQLMNDEGKRDTPRMRWLADGFVRPLFEVMRARVESAQAHGILPRVPAVSVHYIALGAMGLAFSESAECRYVTGVDPTTEEFAERHADAVLQLLMPEARATARARTPRAPRAGTARSGRRRGQR